jgi:amino acid transporter/mannitol/fructose-specific phosphotransferase system IIA component (Ntr-type)
MTKLDTFAGFDAVLPLSALITFIFVMINIAGVKGAAKMEVALVLVLFILMAVYTGFGIPAVKVSRFEHLNPYGNDSGTFNALLATAGFVFVSFGGLLNIASISEEIKNPKRNIPFGMISSVIIITVIYSLILFVTVGVMEPEALKNSLTPVSDAARVFMGTPGFLAMTAAAVLAFVTTANAGIMSASRYPLALSRDKLVPEFLSAVSRKFKTPVISIIFTGAFIVVSLMLPLETLVKAASTVIITSYILAGIAVVVLRESRIQSYRPSFKTPFYPWTQIISITLFVLLIIDMGKNAIEISLGLVAFSLLVYLFYGKKIRGEYALLHLLERVTNRKLTSRNLESELREIIHERDNVVKDDFDVLVENAGILDIKESVGAEGLFRKAAARFAVEFNIEEKNMYRLFAEREEESSTSISPFAAIPHIILEGENIFRIVIVRCSQGACFSEENNDIKAIFFIIGTKDRRNLHLRTLAAIAQILQNPSFEERWMSARNPDDLRDILLLGARKRTGKKKRSMGK